MHAAAAQRDGDFEGGEPGLVREQGLLLDNRDGLVVEILHNRTAISSLSGGIGHGVYVIEAEGLSRADLPLGEHTIIGAIIPVACADLHAGEHHGDGHEWQAVHRPARQVRQDSFAASHG